MTGSVVSLPDPPTPANQPSDAAAGPIEDLAGDRVGEDPAVIAELAALEADDDEDVPY